GGAGSSGEGGASNGTMSSASSGTGSGGGNPVCPPGSGAALDCDGTDDYVTMGVAPSLGLDQFTLEGWFYRTGPGQSAGSGVGGITAIPLIARGRGESDGDTRDCNYFFGLRATDGVLAADFEDYASGANHPVSGTTPVENDHWF